MNNLKEKAIFLTGAGGGVGKATALLLLERGARVFAVQRTADKLAALAQEAAGKPGQLQTAVCDIADEEQVAGAFAACAAAFGGVDVLINNAGTGIPTPDLAAATVADFQTMFDANVLGTFLCTREAMRLMRPQKSGHIIHIVSQAGQVTNPTAPLYCASKHAQRGLSGGTADQVLKDNIKVTDINPAAIDTPYWGDRPVPRDKFLQPQDVAQAVLYALDQPEHVLIRQIDLVSMNQKK